MGEFSRAAGAQDPGSRETCFRQFLRYGGLPRLHVLPMDDDQVFPFLNAILNTILLKDIVKRHAIRDVGHLGRIPDNYPKLVLSMDELGPDQRNGIQRRHLVDFLLEAKA